VASPHDPLEATQFTPRREILAATGEDPPPGASYCAAHAYGADAIRRRAVECGSAPPSRHGNFVDAERTAALMRAKGRLHRADAHRLRRHEAPGQGSGPAAHQPGEEREGAGGGAALPSRPPRRRGVPIAFGSDPSWASLQKRPSCREFLIRLRGDGRPIEIIRSATLVNARLLGGGKSRARPDQARRLR